ncbi:MAG TPA: 5'-3' exonuclease H3TH domain-containing protein [Solirubrobacteraceae bacterium]|jgi:DNA polymerase-1
MPPAPLLIADIPWLLYRAYFGVPKTILGSDGRPVNALLGTVNALLAVVEQRPTRAVVACFGAEQAAYRVELYPPYHAHRDPMPAELAEQWAKAPDLIASLGWTVCDAGELEADDAMFSHARTETEAGGTALLLTADRDLYQALDERTAIVQLEKGRVTGEIGPAQVRDRYHGIGPELVADLIALRGDPSDGLPGAPGIGVKRAAELLLRHGSLEGVLTASESEDRAVRPRASAVLIEHAELLRSFKEIAALRSIPVQRPPDQATDFAGGARGAGDMGMKRLAERLEQMETRQT